jgi:branched-chain amino acid transport system substrate-binding protein
VNVQQVFRWRRIAALMMGAVLLVVGCGNAATSSAPAASEAASAAPAASEAASAAPAASEATFESSCGEGTGQAASGDPIKVGAIMTNAQGIDFSHGPNGAKAFFDCVNANGGIHGRPIAYTIENDEVDPQKADQLASRLIGDDGVVAFVGNSSYVDCAANAATYNAGGFAVIYSVGVPRECFESPAIAATNLGPLYSGLGAAQYAVEKLGAKKIVAVTGDTPATVPYVIAGIKEYTDSIGLPFEGIVSPLPVADPQSVAAQIVGAAGEGGAAVLVFPEPFDSAVMKGAEAAGIQDQIIWTCATPCNDLNFDTAMGPDWRGKVYINSELNLTNSTGSDNQLWLAVMDKYATPDDPRDTFSQAGFLTAKIFVDTVLTLDASQLTKEGINTAIKAVSGYETDLECKPWYFGPADEHVPNNADITIVVGPDGQFQEVQGCTDIWPNTQLTRIRAAE